MTLAWRIGKWIGLALLALILLVVVVVFGLDTQPGKRFLADRIAGYTTASGITVRTSRIDGSIYGRMTLRDVEVSDTKGVFVTTPSLTVDWSPFQYLHKRIEVRELSSPLVTLLRNPVLKPTPTDPNAPTLPDIDLHVGRLAIDRLDLRAPVTGQRHVVRLAGSAAIADGRAQIAADGVALVGRRIAGGDRLHVRLDAVPDADRFALDASLTAPKGGLVDSYAHLGRPLAITIGGKGDWSDWRGEAKALAGGAPLATIGLTANNGTFHAQGDVRPSLILTGPAAALTQPAIQLDLVTRLANRTADTRLDARSDAFTLHAAGLLDFARSRFGTLRLDAALTRPGAIAPNVAGRNVRIQAMLDGPFTTPMVDYRATADALTFGTTGVRGLVVTGLAKVDTGRIAVPVHATVQSVTGLNAAVGGLVTHLRVDGDIVYKDGKIASDNLRLRSDRVDATALLVADLAKGRYTGALKGRVNDYLVNGLGRVNLVTDAKIVPGINNGFAIAGRVRVVTRQITNASVASQLGGNAVITADVGYDLAGGATVRNLRVASPNFHISEGHGLYRPDGRIAFHASGRSGTYGPIVLDVSGTVARPEARLRAASPNIGIGLAGLDATLTSEAGGYRVRASGRSAYGPLDADVLIQTGKAGTSFRIARASLAGIQVTGTVAQTPAGPFAGLLTLAGSGLHGTARLSAAGSVQRADLALRASAAKVPGPVPVTIGGGTLTATVLLPNGAPSVTGQFAFTDIRYSGLVLARAQGRINYANGSGRVQLVAAGNQAGAPFNLAAQAELSPTRVLANLTGTLNGIAVRLAAPAVAVKTGAGWQLQPTTLILPQGQLDVSGRFGGAATSVHAVLRQLDLSIIEPFKPGLGIGGTATGTLDYVGGGTVPNIRARIDVIRFTRTAALTVSDPLDVALLATLNGKGGELRALIKGQGATLGRVQARLAPLAAGASLTDRLYSAPLSGGIRYNGPAELLWALTGIAKQEVSGPVAIGADFGGRLAHPTLTGVVRANALRYENGEFNTVISQMAVDGRFTQSRFELNRLTARAGDGSLSASGSVGLDPTAGFPIDLTATLDKARLANGDDTNATVSGTLHVTNSKANGGLIQGQLTIPQARYQIVQQPAAAVPVLTGVRRKGEAPVAAAPPSPVPSNWKLDITIRADDRLTVTGMGLESTWRTRMHVGGTSTAPEVTGRLEIVRGTFSFNGRRFTIETGTVTFQGGLTDPALNISADADVEGTTVTINIGGTGQRPQITFSSTPALPQDEVLARILFGSSVTSLSPVQAIQLAAALNNLRPGTGGGLNPLGKLRSVAGIDRLRVLGADKNAGRGTSLAAGKYISSRVYVEVITDARGFTATQLDISLSRALSLLSQAGTFGGSNVSLQYKKTY
jgi:translocation and assembly module TamB